MSQETPCIHCFSLSSLLLFNRNNRARKAQTRAGAVIALCPQTTSTYISTASLAGMFRWRNFTVRSYSFTNFRIFWLTRWSSEPPPKCQFPRTSTIRLVSRLYYYDYPPRQWPHLQETEIPSGTRCIQTCGLLAAVAGFTSSTMAAFMWELIKREFPRNNFV